MQGLSLVLLLLISLISVARLDAQKTIDYLGYHVTTTLPKQENVSIVSIRKGRKRLALHRDGIAQDYGSKIELTDLLGTRQKQLVVSQYTGGAHCCTLYWVYELKPRFRLLFQSKSFGTLGPGNANEMFRNIDADPELEIIDHSPAFHYFDGLAFVSSPVPTLVFDYDRGERKFKLANRRFASYLLKDQAESIARSQAIRESNPSQHSVDSLGLLLNFVYAGKERIGWRYYHEEKARSACKQCFHRDAAIRRALNADPTFRGIYGK